MSVSSILGRIEALKYDDVNINNDTLRDCGLKAITLRDEQLYGVGWILSRFKAGHGCILADEMGLGKTCTSISSLLCLKEFCGLQTCLIISPLTVIDNWMNELNRCAPSLIKVQVTGSQSERYDKIKNVFQIHPNVVLTTYEIFLREYNDFCKISFDVCIIDEAHRIKNRATIAHRAIAAIDCPHKLLMTGTPVQNNMIELFSLLHLVAPSVFLDSELESFVRRFSDIGSSESDLLSRILIQFLLRRTKAQVLSDLPTKAETIIYHGLTAIQKRLYRAILTKNAGIVVGEDVVLKSALLNVLMQLRKCILHPYFFPGVEPEPFEDGEHLVTSSGKMVVLDALLRLLNDTGHKSLIFSKFTTMLDIVQDYMSMRGFTYERVDGSVTGDDRYAAINAFNKSKSIRFFLLSTLAGGVGLNLTSADTVVFLDIDFNPQNDLQALSRCHRIGQTRNVKVFRLICKGTVEQVMLSRQKRKLLLSSHVLQNNILSGLTANVPATGDELKEMIGFGAERLIVDGDIDDKVDLHRIMSKIDVGVDGQWPNETGGEADNIIDDGDELDIYDFEGSTYRRTNGRRGLGQVLAALMDSNDQNKRPTAVRVNTWNRMRSGSSKTDGPSDQSRSDAESEVYVNDIIYVRGDVASVLRAPSQQRKISVLCVDRSGTWPGNSRLFESFADSCPSLPKQYSNAAKRRELKLGVVQLIDANNNNQVALVVATREGTRDMLSIKAFTRCMSNLSDTLKDQPNGCDIHFPRIGFGAKGSSWNDLERIIRKHLCKFANVQVYVHYLPRPRVVIQRLHSRFKDIFAERNLRILDDDDEIRRLAIAYGAESAELETSSGATDGGNAENKIPGFTTQTVTKQWILDSIAQGRALPTG